MRRASLRVAVSLAAGLAAAPFAAAQPVAVFSAETSLVNVAVTVEDAHGRPIDGLAARDFVLRQDGRKQKIDMCARVGEAGGGRSTSLDVALLVDTSDSMLETLRRSQEAAVRFLASLPNAQEIIVVFFDQTQRVEHFDRERPEALFERLKTIPDGGNTALRDAIVFSLRALGTSGGRSALVLLTDGIDTVSATTRPELDKAVQSTAVTIYPVAYPASPAGDGPDPQEALKELNRLAQVTGGRLFKLPNEQALPGVLDEIAADLRAQYVLGFAPEAAGSPGLRKISVTCARPREGRRPPPRRLPSPALRRPRGRYRRYFASRSRAACARKMYWAQVSTTYSFSPQRNGQSSMCSGKSGFRISTPGTTPPAMNEKSARLLPYAVVFERPPTPDTNETFDDG